MVGMTGAAGEEPPRNIVLLSDGTGNSRGKLQRTNVWRMYEAVDLADPPDPEVPRQFAFYDDGVGTSSFKPAAILGGALGWGLSRNVMDLYAFLCRMYRPGDRIYAFGFSRGAFTIRVLLGLIHHQGIVRYHGNEAELARLVLAAYRAYRRRYTLAVNYIGPLRDVRDAWIARRDRKKGRLPYGWAWLHGVPPYFWRCSHEPLPAREQASFQNHTDVPIAFVGLWDTVAAYGMPIDELATVWDKMVWPTSMPTHALNDRVQRAVHALSLDDERNTFHPQLWDAETTDERISQVWFAGVHSDVGGGYADQGLSHVSLDWVMTEACAHGLRVVDRVRKQQQALSDENGPMNDSRAGIAGYYRYNPRRMEEVWDRHSGGRPAVVHRSVLRRIRAGQDAYAPLVVPESFDVMDFDGRVTPASRWLNRRSQHFLKYSAFRARAFDCVWLKRAVYFTTLGLTAVAALLPWLGEPPNGACTSWLCWSSPLIRILDIVLPASLIGWTHWYAMNPAVFWMLFLPVVVGLSLGGVLQTSISDTMRAAWRELGVLRLPETASPHGGPSSTAMDKAIRWLRTRRWYRTLFLFLKRRFLPCAFGFTLVYAAVSFAISVTFALQASSGLVCKASAASEVVTHEAVTVTFHSHDPCAPTGLALQAGGTYEVTVVIGSELSGEQAWSDRGTAADLRGVRAPDVTWAMRLGTPLRRELTQPWFLPMARLGAKGTDLYPLVPDPSVPTEPRLTTLRTTLVARTSGDLFFYVNDALGPPLWRWPFYDNNSGRATVTVRLKQFP